MTRAERKAEIARIKAREAYGIWNTAGDWNRLPQTPLSRAIDLTILFASWAIFLLPWGVGLIRFIT